MRNFITDLIHRKYVLERTIEDDMIFNSKEIEKDYFEKNEKWKPVELDGVKTEYEVSSKGRVRTSLGFAVKQFTYDRRYACVELTINGKPRVTGVHRLVARAFAKIPKRHLNKGLSYDDLIVNHIDGYKWHNTRSNLEWLTEKENMKHARDTGLNSGIMGENSHLSTITNKTAKACCELLAKGWKAQDIADKLHMSKKMVNHIKYRECWREISKDYVFPKLVNSVPYKFTDEQIHEICKLLEEKKYSDTEIANQVGVNRRYVNSVRHKKYRPDITSKYNF